MGAYGPRGGQAVGRVVLSRMGIDPTTYTVDAEVPRLGTWAGLLLGFGQHRADARWTMHYLSLMPSSVLLVFGDRSSLVGCVHLDRCRVEVPEHHSDELHGALSFSFLIPHSSFYCVAQEWAFSSSPRSMACLCAPTPLP